MIFMVIEHFRAGRIAMISARFAQRGRMLPDGLHYRGSWIDDAGSRCFQVMEAERVDILSSWIAQWDDLIDFEVVPVMQPHDYWNEQGRDYGSTSG